ncbi:MAG TPA: hypothetical protein V6D12_18300, partial [Candidatus Obscuribacterales bacterium]
FKIFTSRYGFCKILSVLNPTILPIVFKVSLFKSCALVSIALVASVDAVSAAPATPAQAAAYAKPIFAAGFNKTGLGPRTQPNEVLVSCQRVRNTVNTFTCRGKRKDNYCNGITTVYKTSRGVYKHKNDNIGCRAS